jgi:hypothetical protein
MKPTLEQGAACPMDCIARVEDVSNTLEFRAKEELPALAEEEAIAPDDPL